MHTASIFKLPSGVEISATPRVIRLTGGEAKIYRYAPDFGGGQVVAGTSTATTTTNIFASPGLYRVIECRTSRNHSGAEVLSESGMQIYVRIHRDIAEYFIDIDEALLSMWPAEVKARAARAAAILDGRC